MDKGIRQYNLNLVMKNIWTLKEIWLKSFVNKRGGDFSGWRKRTNKQETSLDELNIMMKNIKVPEETNWKGFQNNMDKGGQLQWTKENDEPKNNIKTPKEFKK